MDANILSITQNYREPETEVSSEIRQIRTTIHELSEFLYLF